MPRWQVEAKDAGQEPEADLLNDRWYLLVSCTSVMDVQSDDCHGRCQGNDGDSYAIVQACDFNIK